MNKTLLLFTVCMCLILAGMPCHTYAYESQSDPELLKSISNMEIPVVVINTVDHEEPTCDFADAPEGEWGAGITNASKVPASLQIIHKGDTLYDSGDYIKKESGLTVKIRGNGSGRNPKKSYKLKLQKKADLLIRGDKKFNDKDWVLLRNAAGLVSPIGFWTSELIGQEWTPTHEIVNVWMNGTFRGLYILCESVSTNNDCRINIDEKDGYVVEADPYWWLEDICFSSTLTAPQLKFTYKYPDPDDITEEWHAYISEDVLANEAKITNATFDEAYDCDSFAKWLVGWNIIGNIDPAGGNMFLVKKDAKSKITMGPMWDFDGALDGLEGWNKLHYRWFYFHHLLQSENNSFRKAFVKIWENSGRFVVESLINRINEFADSPAGLDYQKSIELQRLFNIPVDSSRPHIGNLEFMRQYAIDFLSKRADWIDSHLEEINSDDINGANCIGSVTDESEYALDILGRKVTYDTPGLQIRNGKKIFVKP